jgi:hypothetical protein
VHLAVGVGDDHLVAVVAVEVGEHRRGLGVAVELLGPVGELLRVAVQEELAPVLPGQRVVARERGDDLDHEPVRVVVRAPPYVCSAGRAVLGPSNVASGRAGTAPRARRCRSSPSVPSTGIDCVSAVARGARPIA